MAPTIPLDTIYTANEAAERLRLTNRGIIRLAKHHGLCSRRGRDYLFSERDLLALWEALREPPKEPKSAPLKPALSDYQLRRSLLQLTGKKKRRAKT